MLSTKLKLPDCLDLPSLGYAVIQQAIEDVKSISVPQRGIKKTYQIFKCGKKMREDAKDFIKTSRLSEWAITFDIDIDTIAIQEGLSKYTQNK